MRRALVRRLAPTLDRVLRGAGWRVVKAAEADTRLGWREAPAAIPADAHVAWQPIGEDVAPPDPEGREWLELASCPVCGGEARTVVNPWNKFILLAKAIDESAARYDYAMCHACGVVSATRRPRGSRYRFMLEHFGEVTAKRGGSPTITNRVLNPYPLSDGDREELRRRAAPGVFVSDHLKLRSVDYLGSLLRDRLGTSLHADILVSLLDPQSARVLEVRSRTGSILDMLRRAWDAQVCAMPIWESQQFLLREVYGIDVSDLIDFEQFSIPFEGTFDLILCNHMFTHALHPQAFFAELRRKLRPGGHVYLYGDPDDTEYLDAGQSMLAALNPLHLQAFDQGSLLRGLAANGFEVVFSIRHDLKLICLARQADAVTPSMTPTERDRRLRAYAAAYAASVLRVDEAIRGRFAGEWDAVVRQAVETGVADFDRAGRLRFLSRKKAAASS